MMKNEYRRALIMLRPNEPGYSGHVRLERRTLMGSMYFLVNAPGNRGNLQAALVGRKNCEYYAAPIGTLRRDGRGQASLAWSFDPRNIDGRALEDYMLVAVTLTGSDGCALVLTGNVDGSCEADWGNVRNTVCMLFARREAEPAWDLPEPAPNPEPDFRPNPRPEPMPAPMPEAVPETTDEPVVLPPDIPNQEPAYDPSVDAGEDSLPAMAVSASARTAGELLGVDLSSPWAAAIEPLRSLFASRQPVPAPFDDDDDYVYIRVDMPAGSGYEYALAGLEVDDGRIERVRFALPSRFSVEPPAGLEDYMWMGGPSEGFWVLTADPITGMPAEYDD